jgi:hypothetical protein
MRLCRDGFIIVRNDRKVSQWHFVGSSLRAQWRRHERALPHSGCHPDEITEIGKKNISRHCEAENPRNGWFENSLDDPFTPRMEPAHGLR